MTASAQKLHNNPEFLPGLAKQAANGRAITASLQRRNGRADAVPTRLANDGWWLCSLPSTPARGVQPAGSHSKSNRQMTSNAIAALRLPILLDSIPRKLIVALAADRVSPTGCSTIRKSEFRSPLFLLVLGGLSLLTNPRACRLAAMAACRRRAIAAVSLPWLEEFNALSSTLAVLAVGGCRIVTDQSADWTGLRARYERCARPVADRPVPHFSRISHDRSRWSLTLRSTSPSGSSRCS